MPESREIEYWDKVSETYVADRGIKADNYFKRVEQIRRLLEHAWEKEDVLEIGCGNAMIAGVLKMMFLGNINYTATELSNRFIKNARKTFGLDVHQIDVRELHRLEKNKFSRIIAFDSLEHVRPGHRELGYHQIASMAKKGCKLFIHYSDSPCSHDPEFDHPFGLEDISALEGVGFRLNSFERYDCYNPAGNLNLVFLVMEKCD